MLREECKDERVVSLLMSIMDLGVKCGVVKSTYFPRCTLRCYVLRVNTAFETRMDRELVTFKAIIREG
jgi:hypothetical protein